MAGLIPQLVARASLHLYKKIILLFLLCLFGHSSAYADGVQWLSTQFSNDSGYSSSACVASPFQSTAETLQTYSQLNVASTSDAISALSLITANIDESTEALSRKIIVNTIANNDVQSLINVLLLRRNVDGGFGDFEGFDSTAFDTALALSALNTGAYADNQVISTAVGYLLDRQNTDGGWFYESNDSSVYLTSLVIDALLDYKPVFANVTTSLANAQAYLISQKSNNDLWGEVFESALSIIAIASNAQDTALVDDSINALNALQLSNGSWGNDVYQTALALRAVDVENNLPVSSTRANVSGAVVDSTTGAPLENTTIAITGPTSSSINSSASGDFDLADLEPGTYTLQLSLQDYVTVSFALNAVAGQSINLGDIPLTRAQGAATGIVRGTVTDQVTGNGLSGVTVIVGALSTITNAGGDFQISNVTPGMINLSAAKAGFSSATGSGQLGAGGVLNFSPSLLLAQANASSVTGMITNGSTGLPLQGVTVSVSGASTASAITDDQGAYTISGVDLGEITIETSLSGFFVNVTTTTLSTTTVVNYSPQLYPVTAPPPSTTDSSDIVGTVVNAADSQSLEDVSVQIVINGSTQEIITDATGAFNVQGLAGEQASVTFVKAGFNSITATVPLLDNTTIDLGQVALTLIPVTNTAGVKGKVIDASNAAPLENVSVQVNADDSSQTLTTNANGEFEVMGLTGSQANLTFTAADFNALTIRVPLQTLVSTDIGDVRLQSDQVETLLPDLIANNVSGLDAVTNTETLAVTGSVSVDVANIGTLTASAGVEVLAFYDVNKNEVYDVGADTLMGAGTTLSQLQAGDSESIAIPVSGSLPFRDAPISVWVDSQQAIPEMLESNNLGSSATNCGCNAKQNITIEPTLKYTTQNGVTSMPVVGPLLDTNSDSVIDENDDPFIVSIASSGRVSAVNGATGVTEWTNQSITAEWLSNPALGDIDADGVPEVLAFTGLNIIALNNNGDTKWISSEQRTLNGGSNGSSITLADIDNDEQSEVIGGDLVLNSNGSLRWRATSGSGGAFNTTAPMVADLDLDGNPEILIEGIAHRNDGSVYWQRADVRSGQGAIVNLDDDPFPEIVLNVGTYVATNGVYVLEHDGTTKWGPIPIGGIVNGGAPVVVDVDGDGSLEIGVVGQGAYYLFNSDGSIRWQVPHSDGSTFTSASAFDLNADGIAEIFYRDESTFRILNGVDGGIVYATNAASATGSEYPIVVDVDGDGATEIVVPSSGGILVYENVNDDWVSARKIWNQHAYHVTNVNDNGSIPTTELNSWQENNTYRSNIVNQEVCAVTEPSALPDFTLAEGYSIELFASNVTNQQGPTQLAVSPDGDIYIAQGDGGQVVKIPAGSNEPVLFGDVSVTDPDGVAVGEDGSVISAGSPVVKYGTDGIALWQQTCPVGNTQSVAVDEIGNVFVGSLGSQVCKISTDGSTVEVFGGFNRPNHPVVGPDGFLYVHQNGTNTIVKVDSDTGEIIEEVASNIRDFAALTFDSEGNFYIGQTDRIHLYDLESSESTLIATGFRGTAIGFDSAGVLYVGENETKNIYKITKSRGENTDVTASLLRVIDNGAGQPFSLSVRVGNGGAAGSPNGSRVSFFEGDPGNGGVLLGAEAIAPLASGEFVDVALNNVTELTGSVEIFAVVDSNDALNECREDNNVTSIPGPELSADLNVSEIDTTALVVDETTGNATGVISVSVNNLGTLDSFNTNQVIAFIDNNLNGEYDAEIDTMLGVSSLSQSLVMGGIATVDIVIDGQLSFRDAPISVVVDGEMMVDESDETNNVNSTAQSCVVSPDVGTLITDPNDPRSFLDATVGTFAQLLYGGNTPENRQRVIDDKVLVDGLFDASVATPAIAISLDLLSSDCLGESHGGGGFGYTCFSDSTGNAFDYTNAIDNLWVQTSNVIGGTIFDLGFEADKVAVFNAIDHGPLPQEAIESTIYLSNDQVNWVQGVTERVWLDGFLADEIYDGFVYTVGTPNGEKFRYASPIWGGPGALIADGDNEINGLIGLNDDLTQAQADLTASRVRIIDNGAGNLVDLIARVGNAGGASSSSNVTVSFYEGDPTLGGVLLGSTSINSVAGGTFSDVTLAAVSGFTGTTDIYVFADADEQVAECDETNNISSITIADAEQVISGGIISVSTDQLEYDPRAIVNLQSVATNTSVFVGDYTVELNIRDEGGALVEQVLAPSAINQLVSGGAENTNETWNSTSYLAGSYTLEGILRSVEGEVLHQANSTFDIRQPNDISAGGLRLTTDRQTYHTTDAVDISNLVQNVSENTILENVTVFVTVTDDNGNEVYSMVVSAGELAPSALRELLSLFDFQGVAEGTYTINAELRDGENNVLASDQTTYSVVEDLNVTLTGEVAAQSAELIAGELQICTDTINNIGTLNLSGQEIRQLLVNIDTQEQIDETFSVIEVPVASSQSFDRNIDTVGLAEVNYACLLQTRINGQWETIDFDAFVVNPAPNIAPIANAGADQTGLIGDTITLDGSASNDPDFDPITFQWSLIQAPAGSTASLNDATNESPQIVIDRKGDYLFELVVNDGTIDSLPDTVGVVVGNTPPVANAGADQNVNVNDIVTIDGSGSTDNDGDTLTYAWTITSAPTGSTSTLSNETVLMPTLVIDRQGSYIIQLIVNDGTADSIADTVMLTVDNVLPVANAGMDQTVNVNDVVVLDASTSSDVDGDALTYQWSIVNAPAGSTATLSDATAVMPTLTIDEQGQYEIQLIVNDGLDNSTPDTILLNALNTQPIANAGPDQSITVGSTATLNGIASEDPDGDELTYSWTIISKPTDSAAELSDSLSETPSITIDRDGMYVIQLIVNDGFEDSEPDTVVLNVANVRPIANAGVDQGVETGNLVTLDGSASNDPDNDPITYQWSLISIPTGSAATLNQTTTVNPTFIADVDGMYIAQLIVNDGTLDSEPDTVVITSQIFNQSPDCSQAEADPDQLWPPNHAYKTIHITNVIDPENNSLSFSVLSITQDEPTNGLGDGDTSPDAQIVRNQIQLRRERQGGGNGRVYQIHFEADDGQGGLCTGTVQVGVPKSKKKGQQIVDDGQSYDSFQP